MGQWKMENNDRKFEKYLREFQPRTPRALSEQIVVRQVWPRRIEAAAVIAISLGASMWFARKKYEIKSGEVVARNKTSMAEAKSPVRSLALVPLTQLALQDPEQLDEQLTAASATVLPDFRGSDSTLRALA